MLPNKRGAGAGNQKPGSGTRTVDTRSVEWLLALSGVSTPRGNEQNNEGLESIGEAVTSDDKSKTPMDDNGKDDLGDVKALPKGSEPTPSDDNDSNTEDDNASTSDTSDDANQNDDSGDDDTSANSDDSSDDTTSSDEGDGEEETPQDPNAKMADSPHLSLNRRIIISTKLLDLFDSINDSMERIANGPSFENKPTILENLNRLQDSVKLLLETVNKVKEYQTLMVEYAMCVLTYKQLICN